MKLTRCYKYRLRPTAAQVETLVQWAGCRRWLWNWALQRKQAHYGATGKSLSYNTLASELVDLKRQPGTLWLKACHSQVLQQVLVNYHAHKGARLLPSATDPPAFRRTYVVSSSVLAFRRPNGKQA